MPIFMGWGVGMLQECLFLKRMRYHPYIPRNWKAFYLGYNMPLKIFEFFLILFFGHYVSIFLEIYVPLFPRHSRSCYVTENQ